MSPKFSFLSVSFLLILFLVNISGFAQIRIVSPYSRYGIGDLSQIKNAWNADMGQLSIGIQSPTHVNYSNPGSYGAFDSLSFVFEGGFNGELITLTSSVQKETRSYSSLGYLLFGMPVNKYWKTSVGLIPYSQVGYNVATYQEFPTSGTVARLYTGSGGVSQLYWGNAVKFFKKLTVGVNASYLFGSMIRQAIVLFPDSTNALNFKENFYVTINDIQFSFGAQYRTKIAKDLFMTLGAVYTPVTRLSAETDILATTFLVNNQQVETVRDTLANKKGYSGDIKLPAMAGGGISFEHPEKWMIGIDYKWQNWANYSAFELPDSLVNSWHISAGGQFIPNVDNYNNYLARVHYRFGFIYRKTYLHLRGLDLNEYAFSMGFGFPLRGIKTMVNLGFQFGTRGTTEANLIKEGSFRMVVGFSIYERWFVKRKYF